MTENSPIRITTISDNPDPQWVWIRDLMGPTFELAGRKLEWSGFSTAPERVVANGLARKIAGRAQSIARWRGAQELAKANRENPFDVIVSHGPLTTAWTEFALRPAKRGARHLAFSFNFTDLPAGLRKNLMQRAFSTVDAFAVFTDAEQTLYADWLDIDPAKLIRAPWGVAPPLSDTPVREIEAPYIAALGGEARDYKTLCDAVRLCPETQFVAIARPHNFEGLETPENLSVLFNLPFERAWGIVAHSKAALIPLRSRETPCGLVTLVGGMHLGKAQIVTDAVGVSDYVTDGKTGLTVPAQDPVALAGAVRKLLGDPGLADRLGLQAKAYAETYCSEAATIDFFEQLLKRWFG